MWKNRIWGKWLSEDYNNRDEHGNLRLKDDAPEEVKKEYQKYLEWLNSGFK